jgi:hypothetical protein
MKKDEELVAQQAVEFWSTICDVEVDILMEMDEVRLHVCFPLFLKLVVSSSPRVYSMLLPRSNPRGPA